jgi:hypothetical protein
MNEALVRFLCLVQQIFQESQDCRRCDFGPKDRRASRRNREEEPRRHIVTLSYGGHQVRESKHWGRIAKAWSLFNVYHSPDIACSPLIIQLKTSYSVQRNQSLPN